MEALLENESLNGEELEALFAADNSSEIASPDLPRACKENALPEGENVGARMV